ncbi:hypothetical protein [Yoonia vestfoldensis]|uniref:hypothetical protein n=1 Tax=Yoonia vestfoldensis TaxID=245188 RepID=UPI000371C0E9|nr:hypothetical protein [Yoonia vestfoldensis]
MILSRSLARKRIAAQTLPSFRAAWAPVAFDIVAIVLVLAVIWQPVLTMIYVAHLGLALTILVLFTVIYVPFQVVAIVSTIWAVRSRWTEKDEK